MSNSSFSDSGGAGLPTLLFVIFVVLKLTGVIAWPWVWVLSPLWIGLSLLAVLYFVLHLVVGGWS